jgi:hypothetical protein
MGSRSCLGKHIAMLKMLKIVPTLVQKFDMQLEEPDAQLNTVSLMLNMVKDLRCYVTPRKAQIDYGFSAPLFLCGTGSASKLSSERIVLNSIKS